MPTEGSDAPAVDASVRGLLDEWVQATLDRDAQRYADLFVREPSTVVVWANGDVSRGWKAVHDHALRELYHAQVHVQGVDFSPPHVTPLAGDALAAVFDYVIEYRDFWGTVKTTKRLATMTLVRTKDGLRIASAHFSRR